MREFEKSLVWNRAVQVNLLWEGLLLHFIGIRIELQFQMHRSDACAAGVLGY